MSLRVLITCAVVFVLVIVSPLGLRVANAVPILQLYLEGGTYNDQTESWELTPPGSSAGEPFRLWAIGNVGGPGEKGAIENVRLSAAFSNDAYNAGLTISSINGSTTGGYGGFYDPSEPASIVNPSLAEVHFGGTPTLGDGTSLPTHGIYGPDTVWQEFALGDFTLMDSPVGDFIDAFPTDLKPNAGQINVYEISVLNGHGFTVHFDLYDTIVASNHSKFAPFSHDADGDANIVPEPSSLVVWSLFCGVGFAVQRWRRRKAS